MPVEKAQKMRTQGAQFHDWVPPQDGKVVVRLATAFSTPEEHVEKLIELAKS
jgi:threonine aldolase